MINTTSGVAASGQRVWSVLANEALASQRILVTGGSGFIGSNLMDFFLASGATRLANFDLAEPRNSAHRSFWQRIDLRDREALIAAVRAFAPTAVLHMGARTDLQGTSLRDYAANIEGVANIIDAVLAIDPPPPVVFASSRLVCRIG
ncbi:MAG TPA: NAD-dependent epimerase/dehydratase family protein, partial [Rhodospirillales bacterium]|nr:NAD-dependent epimerase/dehydratase family protein [Rhodospirillales bacterium]